MLGMQLQARREDALIAAGERADDRAERRSLAREELDIRRTDKLIEILLEQRKQASMIPDETERNNALKTLDTEISRLQRSMGGGFGVAPSQSAIPDFSGFKASLIKP